MKSLEYDQVNSIENANYDAFKKKNLGKKIVLIYGNCHTTALRMLLEKYYPFSKDYAIYPIKAIQEVKDPNYFKQLCFSDCDLFIHQSIQINNRYGREYSSEYIMRQLKTSCIVIAIPNVYHLPVCFFPQYSEKQEWKDQNGRTLFFRDSILDSVFKERFGFGRKRLQVVDRYNHFNTDHLDEQFIEFIDKVRKREKDWDIKCVDFILTNYKYHRLFFDPNHPTPFFIQYIAKQLLKMLGCFVDEQQLNSITPCRLDSYEMPICDCVYEHFKMQFKKENIRAKKTGYFNNLDLKQYIKCYWLFEWQNEELSMILRALNKIEYLFITFFLRFKALNKRIMDNLHK